MKINWTPSGVVSNFPSGDKEISQSETFSTGRKRIFLNISFFGRELILVSVEVQFAYGLKVSKAVIWSRQATIQV